MGGCQMTRDHTPFGYRPEGADRVTVPADVCDTCSDFTSTPIKLVPASFCLKAWAKLPMLYPWEGGRHAQR
jgi:hypothetical protein